MRTLSAWLTRTGCRSRRISPPSGQSNSYTLFFVLYPSGAGSEFYLAYNALQTATGNWYYVLLAVLALYFPCTCPFACIGPRRPVGAKGGCPDRAPRRRGVRPCARGCAGAFQSSRTSTST